MVIRRSGKRRVVGETRAGSTVHRPVSAQSETTRLPVDFLAKMAGQGPSATRRRHRCLGSDPPGHVSVSEHRQRVPQRCRMAASHHLRDFRPNCTILVILGNPVFLGNSSKPLILWRNLIGPGRHTGAQSRRVCGMESAIIAGRVSMALSCLAPQVQAVCAMSAHR